MRIFRKLVTGFLCAALMVSVFSACGKKEEALDLTTQINATTTKATTTAATTTATTVQSTEKTSPNIQYFVPQSAKADKSYFDDVVFVGDSVSLKLYYYDMKNDCLGNAVFLTSGSLGVTNCLWGLYEEKEVHPTYNGQKMRVPDGVKATGRTKVYIMLGMNDIGLYGIDQTLENLQTLIAEIKTGTPNAQIFMQSVTPIYGNMISITNDMVNQYNQKLSELCKQQNWYYIDVASALRDENGALPLEYCGDPEAMGIHFSDAGCQVWADYLYTHTAN